MLMAIIFKKKKPYLEEITVLMVFGCLSTKGMFVFPYLCCDKHFKEKCNNVIQNEYKKQILIH